MPNRAIQDTQLTVNTALGNNNSTTSTNAVDLGAVTPFPVTDKITVQIVTTAGNGANNKNVNITIQHSDVDLNANFANMAAAVNALAADQMLQVGAVPGGAGSWVPVTGIGGP